MSTIYPTLNVTVTSEYPLLKITPAPSIIIGSGSGSGSGSGAPGAPGARGATGRSRLDQTPACLIKEGRYSDSPCPWDANGKRFAFTHWRFMGIGGDGVRRSLKSSGHITRRGDTPIRPAHGRPMESASHSLVGASWASAETESAAP